MKRRYFYLGVAILSLFVLSIAVFVGCSAAYQGSAARMEAPPRTGWSGSGNVSAKTSVAADPTPRRIIESQPGEELWIIGRADKQQPTPGEFIPGSGVL